MRIWQAYEGMITRNCLGNAEQLHGLPYWSNRLFATMLIYLFPLFIIALIPGVYMSMVSQLYGLAAFDVLIVIAITIVALLPGLSIYARKAWFIGLVYLLAIVLLYYLGWYGPGLLYLLAITFFCLLVFHGENPFCTVYMNTAISVAIGVALHFHWLRSGVGLQYTLGSWTAVSVNLVILSAVVAILLPMLFNGLQQSNNRYETVAQATSDTIWDWDIIHDSILYNYGMNKVFGYRVTKIKNVRNWLHNKIHPNDLEKITGSLTKAFESNDDHLQLDYRFLCADGSYKYIFDRAIILRNTDNGKPVRIIGAMQDITRQKEEEQWLRLTESVLKHATDAVLIVEAETNEKHQRKIVYVNEAFTNITGYSQQETIGAVTDFLWGINNTGPGENDLLNTFEQSAAFEVEIINYKKNGERFWSSRSVSPVKDADGKITHWISIERDITQLKNYVSAIEKQNIQLKEIAWTQAHIVRTPVARIMGLVDLLKHGEDSDELIKLISLSTNELDGVIRGIILKSEQQQVNPIADIHRQ